MVVPVWAEEQIKLEILKVKQPSNGKVIFVTEFNYSKDGLAGVKTKVAYEEDHRPPQG